ncbi:hypothetical protein XarbCFBP7604_17940 [Xanthomonas arboricola]|nr:hypothetical protein XarbCFBP7604_17940 [Xanthomonas arboricola]
MARCAAVGKWAARHTPPSAEVTIAAWLVAPAKGSCIRSQRRRCCSDSRFPIPDSPNPQSPIPNPQSPIPNPSL